MTAITGKLSAIWTKEGDPDVDDVGEENAKAGVRIDFEDEEEFARWVWSAQVFGLVSVAPVVGDWAPWLPGKGWLHSEEELRKHAPWWNTVEKSDVVRETSEGIYVSGGPGDCGGAEGILFEGKPTWFAGSVSSDPCEWVGGGS